jgi:hypothetical protein
MFVRGLLRGLLQVDAFTAERSCPNCAPGQGKSTSRGSNSAGALALRHCPSSLQISTRDGSWRERSCRQWWFQHRRAS